MSKPTFGDIENLFKKIVFPFYDLKRDMDVPLSKRRKEYDAEHSWAVAFIACALAERIDPSLDLGKVAQLAAVHDLVEVFAGDVSIWDEKGLVLKERKEKQALAKIKQEFSTFPWISKTVEQYERKRSKEAKFIWAVDKYIATFTRYLDLSSGGKFYINEQVLTLEQFKKGIEPTRKKAHAHPGVGEYYEEILSRFITHPEWFSKKLG